MNDAGYADYLSRRAELGGALGRLGGLYQDQGIAARARALEETRARLDSDAFRLMVIGEFKRGKSTLINALLREPVLPAKVAPCTGVITILRYGESPEAVLYPREGEPRSAPIAELRAAITIDADGEARRSEYTRAEVRYPLQLLKNNVEILDSPGLNEHEVRTEVALEYLPRADALIWVLSAEMALSRSELDFLDALARERPLEHVFFLWNRYDAVAEAPAEREALRRRSDELLLPRLASPDRVFCVSARDALVAHRSGDAEKLERSGLPAFERTLERFLAVERGRVKLEGPLRGAEAAARSLALEVLPRAEALLREPVDALRARVEAARPAAEQAERQRSRVLQLVERRRDGIVRELEIAVHEFISGLERRALAAMQSVQLSAWETATDRAGAHEKLVRHTEAWLRTELNTLDQERLRPIFNRELADLERELEEELRGLLKAVAGLRAGLSPEIAVAWEREEGPRVSEAERLLGAVTGLFFGGPGPAVEGATFGARRLVQGAPVYISAAVFFMLAGASTGVIAAGLLGVGLVRTALGGQEAAQELRQHLSRELVDSLRAQLPQVLDGVRQRVRVPFAELLVELGSACSQLIAEAQEQVAQALAQREAGERALAEGLGQLAQARATLGQVSEALDRVRASLPA